MITLREAQKLFREDVKVLQEQAFDCRLQNFSKKITFYLRPFEPVSVTGDRCDLSCKHCNKHYLKHMQQADSEESLRKLASSLSKDGVSGLVLSGGTKKDGSVPVYEFAEALKRIKEETGLRMSAHTGVLTDEQAKSFSLFLDAALTDVVGDAETVKEVLGLPGGPEDYRRTLQLLRDAGVKNLSPHIIVGLRFGKISGELAALDLLREFSPENIVIVVLIPTKGTEMENISPPGIDDVSKIISIARLMYPKTNISLSCVRPGGRYRLSLDAEAVKSGVNKMAVPSKSAYKMAKEFGLEIEEIKESRCCSW
jgi:uncharacterized radical SAM superfamily protein